MNSKSTIVELESDPVTGDLILPLSDEILKEAGWKIGDSIKWTDNNDGTWSMTKIEPATELVLVEAIQMYRMRYVVEVPVGKKEWAEDTVAMSDMDNLKEFSQLSLGEHISSSRVISKEDVLELCDVDNNYVKSWSDDQKMNAFVTTWDTIK